MHPDKHSSMTVATWSWLGVGLAAATLVLAAACPAGRTRAVVLGFASFALLLASGLYALRRRVLLSWLGTLHSWTIGHMVLGGLLLLAVVLHGGIRDIGMQGWLLYALTFAEVGSGLWGMAELRATPRRFAPRAEGRIMFPSAARRRIDALRAGIDRTLTRRGPEFSAWFEARYGLVLEGRTDEVPERGDLPNGHARFAEGLADHVIEIVRLRGELRWLTRLERRSRRWAWFHLLLTVALTVAVLVHVYGWILY